MKLKSEEVFSNISRFLSYLENTTGGRENPPPIVTGLKNMMELSSNLKELYRPKF